MLKGRKSHTTSVVSGDASSAASSPNRTSYRPEVDGLRALAVIPVVLYHAGFPAFVADLWTSMCSL